MKMKFLIVLAIAGMAAVGCSSSKNANSAADSTGMDSPARDTSMADTSKKMPDTTKKIPDTTKNQ